MTLFAVHPYYRIKMKKCLPKFNTVLVILCIIVFIYGLYTVREQNNGIVHNRNPLVPSINGAKLYFKAIRRSYFLSKAKKLTHEFDDDETTTTEIATTRKINHRRRPLVIDPIKQAWSTIRPPINQSPWNITPWDPGYHGRRKRADKRKRSKSHQIPLDHRNLNSKVTKTTTSIAITPKTISVANRRKQIHVGKARKIQKHHATAKHKIERKNIRHKNGPKRHTRTFSMPNINLRGDLLDIRVNRHICPTQKDHKSDIQIMSMCEELNFAPYDGSNMYKLNWKEPLSVDQPTGDWSSRQKLKVIIVPHSHVDPGWRHPFDEYYRKLTRNILRNVVMKLSEKPERKFIWAEISFLARWWDNDATDKEKESFKRLLNSGQIEIVTGGWVMNDEAVSHWLSTAQQLTAGQQWLLSTLHYRPRHAWAIDPFGHSAAQPYLLQRAGLTRSVIQRVHYRIKKELALNRQLQFRWRQLWDGTGQTDMFTHLLAFNGYDSSSTCGPDPWVCCQFDFRALTCPSFIGALWNMSSTEIEQSLRRACFMLMDQWRKKAELFQTNVIMVPLGSDFAYSRLVEWDTQFKAYEMFMGHITNTKEWNTEVKFGTLSDYFSAVEQEMKPNSFPVLSGDFFTYADRWNHYWSGYYTSRPFYKRMDRIVLAYVRAAEIITSQAISSRAVSRAMGVRMNERVERARRALALFQHHDAITGTSAKHVVVDYGKMLLAALTECQMVIKQASYFLLQQPATSKSVKTKNVGGGRFKNAQDIYFDLDDVWRKHSQPPQRYTVTLTSNTPSQRVVFYNALTLRRTELVTVIVNVPHVEVRDEFGSRIWVQISPLVTTEYDRLTFAAHRYKLTFPVTVGVLSIAVYALSLPKGNAKKWHTSHTSVQTHNLDSVKTLDEVFHIVESVDPPLADLEIWAGNSSHLVVTPKGMLKAVIEGDIWIPMNMTFVQYGTRTRSATHSGAYLFIPSGQARRYETETPDPDIVVTKGPYVTTVYTSLIRPAAGKIVLAISVINNPSLQHTEIDVRTTVELDPGAADIELGMRLATSIDNGDVFYTDVNGMHMIKRRNFAKLPLQANWYPLGGAAYIQDNNRRLTLLSSTPLGVAALKPGELEVMLDRRLTQDDFRGLNESLTDNLRTRHTFRLILEKATYICKNSTNNRLYGQLSLGAHVSQQMLLQPLILLHYTPPRGQHYMPSSYSYSKAAVFIASDIVIASFRTDIVAENSNGTLLQGSGMTFHRVNLDTCYGSKDIRESYPVGDGQVKINQLVTVDPHQIFTSTLTFTSVGERIKDYNKFERVHDATLFLCPMQVTSVFIRQT